MPLQLVDDKCGESLALDILSNDNELLAALNDLLEQGKDFLNVGDLLICDKNVSVVDNCFHLIGICYHVRSDIASVELHTFNNVGVCLGSLGFFNGDNAVGSNLLHSLSNQLANCPRQRKKR